MRRCPPKYVARSVFILMIMIGLLVPRWSFSQNPHVKREVLSDGVERWYIAAPENGKSYLTGKFEEMYGVVFNKASQPPFGRSIAFLAGVSKYQSIRPQLPSVRNDLAQMQSLLLNTLGFDEVYVAQDDVVDRDLIEHYIKGILRAEMGKNDRLLFYYSGHGGDDKGNTGYMLFGKAKKGEFWGPQVLEVNALSTWSSELKVRHLLFILDSCSSGLAFSSKSPTDNADKLMLQTLSGNGSRTILTAGTADEATFALEDRDKLGNGVFTKALLGSFLSARFSSSPLITVSDLFSDVEKQMAVFRAHEGKATTPAMWRLQEADYRGTFVFLNQAAGAAHLTGEQAKALGMDIRPKASDEGVIEIATGIIEVCSNYSTPADLSIDGNDVGVVVRGRTRQFLRQTTGVHTVKIKWNSQPTASTQGVNLSVYPGGIAYACFGPSPIDKSGKSAVGTFVLQSVHGIGGDVTIDGFPVGKIETNGLLTVVNVTAGPHEWRVTDPKEDEAGVVEIVPNETAYELTSPPDAPTGLTAVVN